MWRVRGRDRDMLGCQHEFGDRAVHRQAVGNGRNS
jgi:hypothetical protein